MALNWIFIKYRSRSSDGHAVRVRIAIEIQSERSRQGICWRIIINPYARLAFSFRRKKKNTGDHRRCRSASWLHSGAFIIVFRAAGVQSVLATFAQGQTNGFVFELRFRVSGHWLPAVERVNFALGESTCAMRRASAVRAFASSGKYSVIYETSVPSRR